MTDPDTIEYGSEGKIPWGIWVIWAGFAAWAVFYTLTYSLPDFLVWLKDVKR